MVAYSFKARFAEPIAEGRKRQTIRGHRRRHARSGELVQLYVGMRTRACRKIVPDPVCVEVRDITIWVPHCFEPARVGTMAAREYVTQEFAWADGFSSAEEFTRFWFDVHGPGEFSGVLIRWETATSVAA